MTPTSSMDTCHCEHCVAERRRRWEARVREAVMAIPEDIRYEVVRRCVEQLRTEKAAKAERRPHGASWTRV